MPTNPDSLDLVQLEKQESAGLGGNAGDELPFAAPIEPQEDAIEVAGVMLQETGRRNRQVALWPDGNDMRFRDISNPGTAGGGHTLSELLSGAGGGITEGQHRNLDQLVHEIAEDYYEEFTYSAGKITNITHWTDAGKTTKIREQIFTYTGNKVNTIVTKQYDGAGVVKSGETMTETFAYSGNSITSITAVMS
jgi:hypothetical protein